MLCCDEKERKRERERVTNPPLVIVARIYHSAEKQGEDGDREEEEEGRISVCRARQTATQVCGGRRGGRGALDTKKSSQEKRGEEGLLGP